MSLYTKTAKVAITIIGLHGFFGVRNPNFATIFISGYAKSLRRRLKLYIDSQFTPSVLLIDADADWGVFDGQESEFRHYFYLLLRKKPAAQAEIVHR